MITGYIGTYATPKSLGVYRFTFDPETGAFPTAPALFYPAPDSKCIALRGAYLLSSVSRGGRAGICLLDLRRPEAPLVDEALWEDTTSCYIAWEGERVATANYHEGAVLLYRQEGDTLRYERRISIAPEAGCHQVLFHEGHILVPCLRQDVIRIFSQDGQLTGVVPFPPGSGPRHGVFDRKHSSLYVICELSRQLFCFSVERDGFRMRQALPVVSPPGSSAAAIRLSEDERFLYISTRGTETVTIFRLDAGHATCIQQVPCGGTHPRDCILTPDGRFLLVANRTSNELTVLPRDAHKGTLGQPCARACVAEGVMLALETTIGS